MAGEDATSSLSSSGAVVSVPVSASSSSALQSTGGAGTLWLVALSLRPARNHSALADGLGKTARVMAAPRRRRAIYAGGLWLTFAADAACCHVCGIG